MPPARARPGRANRREAPAATACRSGYATKSCHVSTVKLVSGRSTGFESMRSNDHAAALEGAPNFRNFGGVASTRGGTVVRGRLFRSGTLHGLSERDLACIDALGISLICDI